MEADYKKDVTENMQYTLADIMEAAAKDPEWEQPDDIREMVYYMDGMLLDF